MAFKSAGLFGRYQDPEVEETIALSAGLPRGAWSRRCILGIPQPAEFWEPEWRNPVAHYQKPLMSVSLSEGMAPCCTSLETLADFDLPVIGINLGRLGFLTDIPVSDMKEKIDEILNVADTSSRKEPC